MQIQVRHKTPSLPKRHCPGYFVWGCLQGDTREGLGMLAPRALLLTTCNIPSLTQQPSALCSFPNFRMRSSVLIGSMIRSLQFKGTLLKPTQWICRSGLCLSRCSRLAPPCYSVVNFLAFKFSKLSDANALNQADGWRLQKSRIQIFSGQGGVSVTVLDLLRQVLLSPQSANFGPAFSLTVGDPSIQRSPCLAQKQNTFPSIV